MDDITALHTAARRYCLQRDRELREAYSALLAAKRAYLPQPGGGWTYSEAAYDLYPRYNVVGAILREIESCAPGDFRSLKAARKALLGAASAPDTNAHPVAVAAELDERERYATFVASAPEGPAEPLPFRRVLTTAETSEWTNRVEARFGRWYGGVADRERGHMRTVAAGDYGDRTPIREAFAARGVERLLELREHGASYELDLELASFCYDGAESYWTTPGLGELVYVSHEDTLTFGGWIVDVLG